MKKLLGAALSAALVFPSGPAGAELLKNMKFSGGLDVQTLNSRNVTDFSTNKADSGGAAPASTFNDRLNNAITRTWASMWWDLLDDVHARVTMRKNDRSWGTTGGVIVNGGNSQSIFTGTAGTNIAGNVFVDEAYMKVDALGEHTDATVGRQFWGEPGDLIAYWGPKNGYGLFVTALDALRIDTICPWTESTVTAIVGKAAGNAIGTTADAAGAVTDRDVRGLNVGVQGLPVKTDVFLWNQVTHANGALGAAPGVGVAAGTTNGGMNDNLWVYGLKLKGEAMGGWAGLTLAANSGQNRLLTGGTVCGTFGCPAASANYSGKALMLDLGYKADISDVGGFTPWFNWAWGTGRSNTKESTNEGFASIASDYTPGVIYGRFAAGSSAVALGSVGGSAGGTGGLGTAANNYDGTVGVSKPGLNNRVIWGLGLKYNPASWSKFGTGLSFWDFNYQRATAGTAGASPAALGNKHIGSEIDLQFDWKHSDNVMLSAGWATFMPGGFIKETIKNEGATGGAVHGNSPAVMAFADMSVRF